MTDKPPLWQEAFTDQLQAWLRNVIETCEARTRDKPLDDTAAELMQFLRGQEFWASHAGCRAAIEKRRLDGVTDVYLLLLPD